MEIEQIFISGFRTVTTKGYLNSPVELTISQLPSVSFKSSFMSLMHEFLSEFWDLLSTPAFSVSTMTSGFLLSL